MEPTTLVREYQPGDSLELDIIEAHDDTLSSFETVTAQVTQVMTVTMAPVMLVTLKTSNNHPGAPITAILKLYDRRFGSSLRKSKKGKHLPCRAEDEAAFRSFVERGDMGPFIDVIQEDQRTELVPNTAADWKQKPNAQAKFEAALWYEVRSHFETEVKAYKRLKDLQGVFIPRMYASVRFWPTSTNTSTDTDTSSTPADSPTRDDDYRSVSGILLQFIPGCSLWDLPESPSAPTSQEEWTSIVQRVVNGANEINKRDIRLLDSCPRNVVVDTASYQPFIIDLAQCDFKDKFFKDYENFCFGDGQEDWNPEVDWCENMRLSENPASIGLVIQSKLGKTQGILIEIEYPDCTKILDHDDDDAKVLNAGRGLED
ncbi:hypothetical protein F53441_9546 [Fusarium austroafricanum]|uniref:Protein kinase domain-containing protein n=1 Tax=Fusarium austroafricanum TaxID=2364996 RepID=A0A8H4K8U5_9HYPO|nr:hypothetical protein F53441_9546 [Fusarium austroafricanum]